MEDREVVHSKQDEEWSWRSLCMPNKSLLIKLQNHEKSLITKSVVRVVFVLVDQNYHEKSLITKRGCSLYRCHI